MTEHAVDPVLRMAGEILVQFRHRPREEAADAVAEHIRLFWDPRLRRGLQAAVENTETTPGEDEIDADIRRVAALLDLPR